MSAPFLALAYSRPAQAIPAPDAEILRQMLEAELARLRCAACEVAASPEFGGVE